MTGSNMKRMGVLLVTVSMAAIMFGVPSFFGLPLGEAPSGGVRVSQPDTANDIEKEPDGRDPSQNEAQQELTSEEPAVRHAASVGSRPPELAATRAVSHPMGHDVNTLSDGGGSFTLEFVNHTTQFSDPHVVAVIAAPPYVAGLNQEGAATGYGRSLSMSTTVGGEVGVHWGGAVGVGAELNVFGIGVGAEVKVAVENEMIASFAATQSATIGVAYTCEEEDYVIYNSMLYDVYMYRITDHYDPAMVNESVTIVNPTSEEPETHIKTLEAYNALESKPFPIGPETFHHEPGKPDTYKNVWGKNAIMNRYGKVWDPLEHVTLQAGWEAPLEQVQQGKGSTTSTIDLGQEMETGVSYSMKMTTTVGVKVAVVQGEAFAGVSVGVSASASVGRNMVFEGSVPWIEKEIDWKEYRYSYGMFVYNYKRPDGHSYQVVDYYVKGYKSQKWPEAPDELEGYWDFEMKNPTMLIDASGKSVHGDLNGPTFTRGRLGDNALHFDGVDDSLVIRCPFPSTDYTFSMWINSSEPDGGLMMVPNMYNWTMGPLIHTWAPRSIIYKRDVLVDRNLILDESNLTHRVMYERSLSSPKGEWITANRSISVGQWHNVVVTVEKGVGQRIYLDGLLVAEGTTDESAVWDTYDDHREYFEAPYTRFLVVGVSYISGDEYDFFNGTIDEMVLFRKVLNDSEIRDLKMGIRPLAEPNESPDDGYGRDADEGFLDDLSDGMGFPWWIPVVVVAVIVIVVIALMKRRKNTPKESGSKNKGSKKNVSKKDGGGKCGKGKNK